VTVETESILRLGLPRNYGAHRPTTLGANALQTFWGALGYHHGEFTGSGHYTVDVLDSNIGGGSRDVWLHIDGETVNEVHLEDEFPGSYKARARDQCSIMLFYHRTTVAKT